MRGRTPGAFTLAIVILGASAALFGGWLERAGPRKAGVVAALCWCGGLLVSALGIAVHQLWLLWLGAGLIGGVIAAQGPEFAQQYAQRLGGALDELRRQIETLDSDAQATGETRDSAIERLRANADALVARRGEAVRGVQAQPFARMALGLRDLARGHFFRHVGTAERRFLVSARRGDIHFVRFASCNHHA